MRVWHCWTDALQRRWKIRAGVLIFLFVGLTYFQTPRAYLSPVDDFHHVRHWTWGSRTPASLFLTNSYGHAGQGGHYRPFEVFSHMLDDLLWGEYTPGRHVTNILLHLISALLVFLITFQLFQNKAGSLLAGVVFAVHPVHSTAVAWIAGRTGVLATVFILLALYFFLRFLRCKLSRYYFFALLAFVFALFSKELAMAVPLAILFAELLLTRQNAQHVDALAQSGSRKRAHGTGLSARSLKIAGCAFIFAAVVASPEFVRAFFSADAHLGEMTSKILRLAQTFAGILAGTLLLAGFCHLRFVAILEKVPGIHAIPFFIVLAFYMQLRFISLGSLGGYDFSAASGSRMHFQFAPESFARDFYGLPGVIWPLDFDYNINVLNFEISHPYLFLGIFLFSVLLFIFILICALRRKKQLALVLLLLLVFMIPVHNLVLKNGCYNPRYLYLASAAAAMLLGLVTFQTGERFRVAGLVKSVLVIIVLFLAAGILLERNRRWMETGKVMRSFVDSFGDHKNRIKSDTRIVFVSFPFLLIECEREIYATAFLHELLNFAIGREIAERGTCEIVLLVKPGSNYSIDIAPAEQRTIRLRNLDLKRSFMIPAEKSAEEIQLASVYDPAWRDAHPCARSLLDFNEGDLMYPNSGVRITNMNFAKQIADLEVNLSSFANGEGESLFFSFDGVKLEFLASSANLESFTRKGN